MTLRAGMYSIFLTDWFKIYPRSQFHIIKSEDYYDDMTHTLKEMFSFLDVQALNEEDLKVLRAERRRKVNRSNCSDSMFPKTRRLLNHLYTPFNQQLAKLLRNNDFLWE